MKIANEMFEKLGFKKATNAKFIIYNKGKEGNIKTIGFEPNAKVCTLVGVYTMTVQLIDAIKQQMTELELTSENQEGNTNEHQKI